MSNPFPHSSCPLLYTWHGFPLHKYELSHLKQFNMYRGS